MSPITFLASVSERTLRVVALILLGLALAGAAITATTATHPIAERPSYALYAFGHITLWLWFGASFVLIAACLTRGFEFVRWLLLPFLVVELGVATLLVIITLFMPILVFYNGFNWGGSFTVLMSVLLAVALCAHILFGVASIGIAASRSTSYDRLSPLNPSSGAYHEFRQGKDPAA